MGIILLRQVMTTQCMCSMLLQEHSFIPIGVIQIVYGRSHGRPIAHALPRRVKIEQSRSGTLPTGEMSLSTKDIPMMSQPLIGGPRILPQEVMIKLYKYGMRSPGLSRTLIPATPKT